MILRGLAMPMMAVLVQLPTLRLEREWKGLFLLPVGVL